MTAWGHERWGPLTLSPVKTGNVPVCGETISVLQTLTDRVQVWVVPPQVTSHHNQKLLPPLASFILLPAPGEGGMSQQSYPEQNPAKQTDTGASGRRQTSLLTLLFRAWFSRNYPPRLSPHPQCQIVFTQINSEILFKLTATFHHSQIPYFLFMTAADVIASEAASFHIAERHALLCLEI